MGSLRAKRQNIVYNVYRMREPVLSTFLSCSGQIKSKAMFLNNLHNHQYCNLPRGDPTDSNFVLTPYMHMRFLCVSDISPTGEFT